MCLEGKRRLKWIYTKFLQLYNLFMISRWTLSLLFTGIIVTLIGIQYLILYFINKHDETKVLYDDVWMMNNMINDNKNNGQHNNIRNNIDKKSDELIVNKNKYTEKQIINNSQFNDINQDDKNNISDKGEIIDPIYIKIKADNFFNMGMYSDAVAEYERLFIITPYDTKTFKKAIISYIVKLKDPKKALILAKKIYDLNSNDAMANNLYGWALLANNQIPQSYQYLSRSIVLDPNLVEGYLNLGEYFAKTGDKVNAKKYWERVIDLNGQNGAISNIAKTLMDLYKVN